MNMIQYEDPKEMSRAINGKMILMTIGIVLIFSAVTSTVQYGVNMFLIAGEAVKGTADYVNALADAGMSITLARVTGVVFVAAGILEIFVGVASVKMQNRLDKAFLMKKLALVLLAVEVLLNIFLAAIHLANISRLFSSLAMPLFLLWAASTLCKLAKKYPDRKCAVDTNKKKQQQPVQKKSLKERAMVPQTADDEEEETEVEESRAALEDVGIENEDAAVEEADAEENSATS